jgi:hypothetical protein
MVNLQVSKSLKAPPMPPTITEYKVNNNLPITFALILIPIIPVFAACFHLSFKEELYILSLVFIWLAVFFIQRVKLCLTENPIRKLILTDARIIVNSQHSELTNLQWTNIIKVIAYKSNKRYNKRICMFYVDENKRDQHKLFSLDTTVFYECDAIAESIKSICKYYAIPYDEYIS